MPARWALLLRAALGTPVLPPAPALTPPPLTTRVGGLPQRGPLELHFRERAASGARLAPSRPGPRSARQSPSQLLSGRLQPRHRSRGSGPSRRPPSPSQSCPELGSGGGGRTHRSSASGRSAGPAAAAAAGPASSSGGGGRGAQVRRGPLWLGPRGRAEGLVSSRHCPGSPARSSTGQAFAAAVGGQRWAATVSRGNRGFLSGGQVRCL